jgi:membrane fusion protein, multidrug efflux system
MEYDLNQMQTERGTAAGRLTIAAALMLFFWSLVLFPSCSEKRSAESMQKPAVPVAVGTAVKKTVPVQIRAIGNVEAYSTVGIKPEVGGVLTKIHFQEGQFVHEGDLLFTIDPRPYKAALNQAQANLARDVAQMEYALQQDRRYEELVKKGYVAQSDRDQIRANSDALDAVVKADKAAVENARLQLSYCSIYSPFTGRTGSLLAHQGDMMKANPDNPMVVINQVQPIYVSFSVPEQYLPEIKRYMSAGPLTVEAVFSGEEKIPVQGVVTFIDNAVDTTTGTIRLKGTFGNQDNRLWPGQFVSTILTLTTEQNAVVVPSEAIQAGQSGDYVFVVLPDSTVESRPVVTRQSVQGETVVEKGIKPEETVVTDGQMRLIPGDRVEIGQGTGTEEKAHETPPSSGKTSQNKRP